MSDEARPPARVGEVLTFRKPPTFAPPREVDVCPTCKGVGWLRLDVPVEDARFGVPQPCDCLQARRAQDRHAELHALSNLDHVAHYTFSTFDPTIPGVAEGYGEARRFTAGQSPLPWLLYRGIPGCGKTHLVAAICHDQVAKLVPTLFCVVPDLMDKLRATYAPGATMTSDDLFDRVRQVRLLCLDDLGTENATPWAQEKLYQLLNYRSNLALPTLLTTNRRLDSLDERFQSRLLDQALVRVVEVKATDYRRKPLGARRPTPPRPLPRI